MIGISVFIIFIGTVKSNNLMASIIIALIGVIALLVFSVLKIFGKNLTQIEICKCFGVFGILSSVTVAGMFSASITSSYQKSVIVFILFLIAQILMIALMEFKYRKKSSQDEKKKKDVSVSTMVPFSVLGLYLSRYVDSFNIKIPCLILLFLFWLVCVSFHNYFIKCRIGN